MMRWVPVPRAEVADVWMKTVIVMQGEGAYKLQQYVADTWNIASGQYGLWEDVPLELHS